MSRLALAVPVILIAVLGVAGCSTAGTGGGDGAEPVGTVGACPTAPVTEPSASPTPRPTPTLDPTVSGELRDAIRAVRAIDGVAHARERVRLIRDDIPDPACPGRTIDRHSFAAVFTVAMRADASTDAAARVPAIMAQHLAWTAVNLVLTVPGAPGRIATEVDYDGTFDQTIPQATSRGVAEGLATLASTPHVTALHAVIPPTMRVDYGSLTIDADTADATVLDGIRSVIDGTAFNATTLHGAFGNGAKP